MSRYEIDIAAYEALRPGHLFGPRYRLISLLGQGGFGKVFQARDLSLDILVALKVLNPILASEASQLSRFKREVIIARKISHPNVCKIFDFGEIDTLTYLTMEYVHGEALFSVLKRHKSLSVGASLEICRQMCSALDAAHREGIVHRDLKPHNVMIERRGAVKIMDFGIARAADMDGITNVGTVMGSPSYMSPEQCRGEAGDPRSDLYSLGVVLYQMLTGAPPFLGNTPLGTLYLHLQQEPRPPLEIVPSLPPRLDAMVLKCMAKDPAKRYATAQELGDEIVGFQRDWRDELGAVSLAELAEPPEIPQIIPISDATESLIQADETGNPSDRSDETSLLDEEPPPTPVRPRPAVLPTLHVDLPASRPTATKPVSHTPRELPAIPGEQHWTDRMNTPTFGTTESQDGSGRSERRVRLAGMTATMIIGGLLGAAGFLAYNQGVFGPGEGIKTDATPIPTLPPEDPQKARIDEFLAQATKLEADAENPDRTNTAASLYRRILLLDPTHGEATARLNAIVAKLRQQALTALSAGRYQEALELAQTALVNLPEDAASKQIFNKALDQMIQVSGATSASLVRARQLIASEQPAAAVGLLQEILDKEPDHREAKALMRRAEDLTQRLQAEETARKAEEERLAQATPAPTAEAPAPTPETAEPTPEPTVEASEPTPPLLEPTTLATQATPEPDTSTTVREGDLVELGPDVTAPVLRDEVRLRLPPSFISQYRGKFIDVRLLVDDDGEVDDVEVVKTPQRSTNATVAQQLTRLRFEPARYRGVRVRCWFPMRIVVQ